MPTIRLAIIEDIDDIRNNLNTYFAALDEISEVQVANSMEAFFADVLPVFKPDIVLSDIGLPGMSGIEGIKKIKQEQPQCDIIMLTVFRDNDKIFKCICAGATGYLLKDSPMEDIRRAVMEIHKGGSYMSSSIARKVLEYFLPKTQEGDALTAKEKQIVQWLKDGHSYKMIADKLSVSHDTIRYHIKKIYKKLHINTKQEAINMMYRGEI